MWRMWKAPDLWWALPATNRCTVSLQVVLMGAPTSLAGTMVVVPDAHAEGLEVQQCILPYRIVVV
jgi:hypothetical protein